ncbi:SGNH/GDSL hydrolase family protein [Larkinella soli]|uniref:SGNH/GDSL hydrolase family protein n=1 Tax=Larkinella soli TaxID=1770527 RepID=UPI000FFBB244|nr:SGNH/GDSL hydrolase family protein [Larkinella soli]
MKRRLILIALVFLFNASTRRNLNWVAIGDSITYLNEHLKETGDRVTRGYMTRVIEKLPHINYVNQGHNGWTAIRIAEQIDKLNLTKADVYSIFLGTNDWWGSRPLGRLKDYRDNTGNGTVNGAFRTIVDKLRSLNPDARIILITPMQRVDFVYLFNFKNNAYGSYKPKNGQTLEAFAQAVDSIGRLERLPVVDLYHLKGLGMRELVRFKRLKDPQTGAYRNYSYPDFIDVPFNPETDEYPYPIEAVGKTYDGLHPSDAGYQLISRRLVRIMKKY